MSVLSCTKTDLEMGEMDMVNFQKRLDTTYGVDLFFCMYRLPSIKN